MFDPQSNEVNDETNIGLRCFAGSYEHPETFARL